MAKDKKSLDNSFSERMRIQTKFGCIPTSVLRHNKNDKAIDIMSYNSYTNVQRFKNKQHPLYKRFMASGMDVRGGALSKFSQNIGRILLKLYTSENDIVFDPFAGHNSRMELCHHIKRNYIGIDISRKFTSQNNIIKKIIKENDCFIWLLNADAKYVPIKSEVADFTITSPPYWDIEFYGDEREQLGKNKKYTDFLSDIFKCLQENYRILKKNTYCCWNINDFRKKGKFYAYHADIMHLMEVAGFEIIDIVIIDLGTAIGACFATQIEQRKYLPKQHEYVIVGKK